MRLSKKIVSDENLHRAAVATVSGELVHLAIDLVLAFFIALGMLPFWGISIGTALAMVFGVFVAHVGIELHDKYDTSHKPLHEPIQSESFPTRELGIPRKLEGCKE